MKVAQPHPTVCTIQSMEFSRSGQPFPSPGDLPNPGIEPESPTLQTDSLPAEPKVGQEYWSMWPIPSPVDLPAGIEQGSPAIAGRFFTN